MTFHPPARFHLLVLENVPIFEQLQLEEALLRIDMRNWCVINTGSPPAIVMGISGKPDSLINRECMAKQPVPLIKRFSGGGTVFVDHNTFFLTWIGNAQQLQVPCCPAKIHRWSETFLQAAFPELNMQLVENDYVVDGRKFGGNAQYLCKDRWLHHSSLLWDFHSDSMHYLLMPPKMPAYRQGRPHGEFLCKLQDFIPSKDQLKTQVIKALHHHHEAVNVSKNDVQPLVHLPHRRATCYIVP